MLPNNVENPDLVKYFSLVVSKFDFSFSTRGLRAPPIWEGEAVDSFLKADREGDWVAIVGLWRRFPPCFASAQQAAAVRFLYRYARGELIARFDDIQKTPVAMLVANILSSEQSLQFGLLTKSPYVELAAVYRSLHDERGSRRELSPEEASLLSEMLVKVSRDVPRWAAWMKIFVRETALQESLGKALVQTSSAALEGYVNAIRLYPKQPKPDLVRRQVAQCLRVFCAEAPPKQRATLWRLACQRWLNWGFNRADPNQHLSSINWSDLDYALVAYTLECLTEAEREEAMESVRQRICVLDNEWHKSSTDMITSYNRLLSEFQPFAHAATVAIEGGDWLPEIKTYMPFDPSANNYLTMMYR